MTLIPAPCGGFLLRDRMTDTANCNQLAETLARIEQAISEAKAIIADPKEEHDNQLMAQVVLADMENARYEVEGKLMGQMKIL